MSPRVVALHLSVASRAPLLTPASVRALADQGLEGDRHARPKSRRSVLIIDRETLDALGLSPGAVREQVTTEGLALGALADGTRLRIGDAVLELAQLCAPCSRMDEIRPGLRRDIDGRRGRFARVVTAGTLSVGDAILTEPPVRAPLVTEPPARA